MKKFVYVIFMVMILFSLVSCGIVSNHMTTGVLRTVEIDGSMYIQSRFSSVYKIDIEDKTFSLVEADDFDESAFEVKNEFKYEFFAGEYQTTVPDEYDGVVKYIEECELDSANSVVDACGYIADGILIGFVQVYKDTSGVRGNYAIEKISHSLIFSYDAEANAFSVVKQFDGIVVVAWKNNTVIYWRDKAYYSYDLKLQSETFLVEDKAYDGGLNQTSTPAVFSNEKMCVLHLVKGKTGGNIEYMYVFDFETKEFFELKRLK